MDKISWDDKYFKKRGVFVYVFNNGCLEMTNDRQYILIIDGVNSCKKLSMINIKNEKVKN